MKNRKPGKKEVALLRDWGWKHFFRIGEARLPPRTPAERLLHAFESAVTARTIAERLHTCEVSDSAEAVLARMADSDFDVLGVRDSHGATIGSIPRDDLGEGTSGDHLRPFSPADLISDSTPLYEVLAVLSGQPRAFLIGGPSVFALVTRADLQKEPVRVYVFALVTILEMQMTSLLRKAYSDEEWQKQLSKRRVARAQELYEARLARNEQLTLFDCLQLCDKRDLLSCQAPLRGALGFTSKSACVAVLKRVEAMRDRVAHAQDLATGSSWPDTIVLLEEMDLMLQRMALGAK